MTVEGVHQRLLAAFGDAAGPLSAPRVDSSAVVRADRLVEVARFLKETPDLDFDHCDVLTGVDWPQRGVIEVVYHLFSLRHRHGIVLKVEVDRAAPLVPSVEQVWKAAGWMERETFDLLGVAFTGHPDLRRLLLPDDWEGHPLRKDYQEPAGYNGISTAREDPLVQLHRVEEHDRGQGTAPPTASPTQGPEYPMERRALHGPVSLDRLDRSGARMLLHFGPQHPSTHGVLCFLVETDGEMMHRAVPEVGYLHRGLEKIGERVAYPGCLPFTDRIDYLAAMFANEGYALAVERLLRVEAPPRAQWLRAISCELCRIASHLVSVGSMAADLGASTPLVHALRERERVNDLLEELCGARLTYSYHRIGGVAADLPDGWRHRALAFLDHFDTFLQEFDRLITFNVIYVKRLAGVAVIPGPMAIDYGLVGPNLRGSGVCFDLRRDAPYGAYPHLDFEVPLGQGSRGTVGDAFDRYHVRVLEMAQSSRIVRQALATLPDGEYVARVPRKVKPEPGEALSRVESARGELAYYLVSDGSEQPYRLRARTGSFTAMGIVEALSPGLLVADLVALIGSLDVVAPEIDR